jgi:hypothetical protein
MAEAGPPNRRRMRTVTVAALLGIFVGAVVLAIAGRFLPGRLGGLRGKLTGRREGK